MSEDALNDEADARLCQVLKQLHAESSQEDAEFECAPLLEKLRRIPELSQQSGEATAIYAAPMAAAKLGQYELLERIAGGGMGEVFKARHQKLGNIVAIKLLYRDRMSDQELLKRFEQEMLAVGRLNHDHIVKPLYADEQDGVPYLVMEYVNGKTLAALLDEFALLGEKFPIELACEAVRQAAIGLQHAHRHGIVHRDIKPSNLIMCRRAEDTEVAEPITAEWLRSSQRLEADSMPLVKILDLGLARLNNPLGTDKAGHKELTREGQVMGTPDYMAPEQLQDSRLVDARTDIYALGATLFKLLVGQAPFANAGDGSLTAKVIAIASLPVPSVKELRPEIPVELERLLRSMLAKSPNDRPSNAAEVINALSSFCVHCPSTERLSTERVGNAVASTLASRWSRIGLAVAVTAVAVLGLIAFKLTNQTTSSESMTNTKTTAAVDEHPDRSRQSLSNASRREEAQAADPDRIAAEWVVSHKQPEGYDGISVFIQLLESSQFKFVKPGEPLPSEPIRVYAVTMWNVKTLTAEQITRYLVPLRELNHVDLSFNASLRVEDVRPLTLIRHLKVMELGATKITGAECVELFSKWPELQTILVSSDQFTDEVAEYVQQTKSIERVSLHTANDHQVQQLLKARQIKDVFFYSRSSAEHSTWQTLPESWPNLRLLSVVDSKITSADLAVLSRCPKLVILNLRGSTLTDADLDALQSYELLEHLELTNTKVTEAAVMQLHAALPKCRITWDGGILASSPKP